MRCSPAFTRQAQHGQVTEFQGYLLKQSGSVRADWKRRFFFTTAVNSAGSMIPLTADWLATEAVGFCIVDVMRWRS